MSAPATIAVVVPVFNEQAVLPELFTRLAKVFDVSPQFRWRAVLVNDGSRDASADLIRAHHTRDARFELVDLSRNFGFQAALSAGLAHVRDVDAAVTMDADLQDPPELIPELVAAWNAGAEVVLAVRRSRAEHGVRRAGFSLFHRFFRELSDFPVRPNTGTFGLVSRVALEALHALPERHRFFPGLRSWIGFRTAEVFYDRQERAAGQPAQTMRRLVRYAMDGIFSFSYLPLRALTYVGLLMSGSGFAVAVFFVTKRLLGIETAQTGFTTLVTLMLFLGGAQLIALGIIGEYLARVYDEVKQRPHYFVRETTSRSRC